MVNVYIGGDLSKEMTIKKQSGRRFGQEVVFSWMRQLLMGLDAMHNAKLMHRDIKPSNVRLTCPMGQSALTIVFARFSLTTPTSQCWAIWAFPGTTRRRLHSLQWALSDTWRRKSCEDMHTLKHAIYVRLTNILSTSIGILRISGLRFSRNCLPRNDVL